MADVKWTDEQLNAIYAHGGTVLVSAAAGSGKTAVLVKRVTQMITDEKNPCSVDELLIVTFTKAAASQMKDKIARELSNMILSEKDLKKRSYLVKQQMLLKCAKVSTIDSFCSDIVKQNMHELDIDSDYKLIDEEAMKVIKDSAYEEVAEKFYAEGDKDFLILADMFTKSNDDKLLKELVLGLYDFAVSYKNPKKWIEEIDKKFCNDKTDFTNEYAKTVIDVFREDVSYCKALAERALFISAEDEATHTAYSPALKSDIEMFDTLLEAMPEKFTEEDWDELIEQAFSVKYERFKNLKEKSDISNCVKILRDNYKDVFKKAVSVLGITSEDNKNDVKKLTPIMKMLSKFTLCFFDKFDEMKKEKNSVDFSDILHMALSLLITEENGEIKRTALAEEYSSQFHEILIDEYQDTNEAQDVLFWAVSNNNENLFFVGDVKQSIYGFRKAMPGIFLKKRKEFNDFDRENPVFPATISLDKNFRSRREVTEFVNFVCTQLMSEGAGEINYNERETLKTGAQYPDRENMQTEIHIIDNDVFGDIPPDVSQAMHIAEEIKKLKENGEFKYGDMAILLRTKKSIPTFVRVLNEMGVNAGADESENLFKTPEVRNMLSLIKVIDNPARDVEILSSMMSPMFSFSADELAQIRINSRQGSFYEAVRNSAEKNEKCKNFLDTLSSFRLLSQTVSPGELVRHIFNTTGYKSIVLSLPDGERMSENLDIFRAFSDSFSSSNDVGLSGFVRQIEKMEKISSVKSASQTKSGEEAVTVMSIHRSKGLEFPVCFIGEAEKDFNNMSLKNDLLAHPQAGIGIIGIDTERMIKYETLSRTAIKLQKEMSDLSEEMRVMYVALTRAKEKLIIVARPKNFDKVLLSCAVRAFGEKIIPAAVRHSGNYLDWLLTASIRHKDASFLRIKTGSLSDGKIKSDFPLEIKIIDKVYEISQDEEKEEVSLETDEEFSEEIKKRTSYVYPFLPLSDALAKRGASTAFKNTIDREYFASDRPAFLNKTSLTAAGRGTAMHAFMQFSDYHKAKENLEKEIERLLNHGFLNNVQAESLDRGKLKSFFDSKLYDRISQSENVYREKKFIIGMSPCEFDENLSREFENERVIVQGILDCAFEENGEIVIVDYKTDRVKTGDVLRERYSSQLKVYERAVRECLGKNVKETLLYSFWLDTTVKI